MTLLRLGMNRKPDQAEIYVNIRQKDGIYWRHIAIIDTGAEVSLLPNKLLATLDYQPSRRGAFAVQQAGISEQVFEAEEAIITLFLEDMSGQHQTYLKFLPGLPKQKNTCSAGRVFLTVPCCT